MLRMKHGTKCVFHLGKLAIEIEENHSNARLRRGLYLLPCPLCCGAQFFCATIELITDCTMLGFVRILMSDRGLHARRRQCVQEFALRRGGLREENIYFFRKPQVSKTRSQFLHQERRASPPVRYELAHELPGPARERASVAGSAHLRGVKRNIILGSRAKGFSGKSCGRIRKQ